MLRTVLPLLALAAGTHAASAAQWQKRMIYQVVTDRFATTDGSMPPCLTEDRQYCGGTWDGLINRLDYIENMGFDAVWISPVVTNIGGNTSYGEAYHGYWPLDLTTLNAHFGTADDLKSLSSALHGRGMYLMVDVVVNHMAAPLLPSSKPAISTAAEVPAANFSALTPFSDPGQFHAYCAIEGDTNQTAVEQCWVGDASMPLADLDTEDPVVQTALYDWIGNLTSTYEIDGIRIDTVKHVRQDFWPGFAEAAGVFTIGEVLADTTDYVAPYTQVLDAVLDYPTWFAVNSSFSSPKGNLSTVAARVLESQQKYKKGAFMTGAFLDNHDQARFYSLTQDQSLLKNAMAWPYMHDGMPIVYYGQEQGFQGSMDPHNREALWYSNYTEDPTQRPLLDQIGRLNAARRAAIKAPGFNFLSTPMKFLSPLDETATIAISKPPMLGLLTNGGNLTSVVFDLDDTGLGPNADVIDVLNCARWRTGSAGELQVTVQHGMPQVLMPAKVLTADTKLCQEAVAQITAVNGASVVQTSMSWVSAVVVALVSTYSLMF